MIRLPPMSTTARRTGRGRCCAVFITPLILLLLDLLLLGVNARLTPWQNGHGPSRNDCDRLLVQPCDRMARNDPFFALCCTISFKHNTFVANEDDCEKDFHHSCNDTIHQNYAFCCIYEGHRCLKAHRCFDQSETLKFLNRWPGQADKAKKMYADGYYCGEHFCCVYEYSTCLKSHRGPNSTQGALMPHIIYDSTNFFFFSYHTSCSSHSRFSYSLGRCNIIVLRTRTVCVCCSIQS